MAKTNKEPDPEKVEAINLLLDSEGWALLKARIERAVEQASGRCETETDPRELTHAQGECRAYRAILGFPWRIKQENQP